MITEAEVLEQVRAEASLRREVYHLATDRDNGLPVADADLRKAFEQHRIAHDHLLAAGEELLAADAVVAP